MLAIVIELLSEPMYIVASMRCQFGIRAKIEGTAVFLKSLSVFLLSKWASRCRLPIKTKILNGLFRDALRAFADAQVIYAAVLLIGYSSLIPSILKMVLQ